MSKSDKFTSGSGRPKTVKSGVGKKPNTEEKRQLCHKVNNLELAQAYNSTTDLALRQGLLDFAYDSTNITRSTHNKDHSRVESQMRKGHVDKQSDFNAGAERHSTGLWHLKERGPTGKKAAEIVIENLAKGNYEEREYVASLKRSFFNTPAMKAAIDKAIDSLPRGSRFGKPDHQLEQVKKRLDVAKANTAKAELRARQLQCADRRQSQRDSSVERAFMGHRDVLESFHDSRMMRQTFESNGVANGRELFRGPRGGVYHMSGQNRVYHPAMSGPGYGDGGGGGPRCFDGSRDMRFASNRGFDEWD